MICFCSGFRDMQFIICYIANCYINYKFDTVQNMKSLIIIRNTIYDNMLIPTIIIYNNKPSFLVEIEVL